MAERPWTVYALTCADGSVYVGVTVNLARRLRQHNAATGSRYTRTRLPVAVLGSVTVAGKSEALRLEYRLKRLPRSDKLAAIVAWGRRDEASASVDGVEAGPGE